MAVKIRLTRCGSNKKPFFKVVVADVRSPRDGKFIEKLGIYDPRLPHEDPKRVVLDGERIKYWLSVGALISDRVQLLASKQGIVDAPVIRETPKKSAPKKKAQERAAEEAAKRAAAEQSE